MYFSRIALVGCWLATYNNSSAVAETATFGHSRHGPKSGVGCYDPFHGGAGSPSNNVAWAEAYLRTKWYPDPSSRLATKVGGLLCPFRRELGLHLTQCGLGRGLSPYQAAS